MSASTAGLEQAGMPGTTARLAGVCTKPLSPALYRLESCSPGGRAALSDLREAGYASCVEGRIIALTEAGRLIYRGR